MSRPLEWLFALEDFGIKFGLDNIRAIVDALGHPERTFLSLHIAGTNGKGSVSAMTERALRAAGYRSGLYTSPHLFDLAERYLIDGRPVDSGALEAAIARVRAAIDQLIGAGTLTAHPTFFEAATAVGFQLFRSAGVQIAVCEVGLGGRLDATNVLEPVATAITTIGLDHQRYLGNTLREIAVEKAGIIKPAVPVVVGALPDDALAVVVSVAREQRAPVILARQGVSTIRMAPSGRLHLRTPARDYGALELALAGQHQEDNAVVAVRLLESLGGRGIEVSRSAVAEGLQDVRWPGRLDQRTLPDGRDVLFDAAHNPDGAAALAVYLRTMPGGPRVLVFGAMRDKDTRTMLAILLPAVRGVVLTAAPTPRSADPSGLAEQARLLAPELPVLLEPSPPAALAAAWRLSRSVVVAGSIFLLGAIMRETGARGRLS